MKAACLFRNEGSDLDNGGVSNKTGVEAHVRLVD